MCVPFIFLFSYHSQSTTWVTFLFICYKTVELRVTRCLSVKYENALGRHLGRRIRDETIRCIVRRPWKSGLSSTDSSCWTHNRLLADQCSSFPLLWSYDIQHPITVKHYTVHHCASHSMYSNLNYLDKHNQKVLTISNKCNKLIYPTY